MQQRRAQRDLEHLTVRQAGVAPEGYGQPYWQAAAGLTQHSSEAFVPGRFPRALPSPSSRYSDFPGESGRHQDFGLPAKAIAGPDLATGWRNSRSPNGAASSPRVEHKQSAVGASVIARWWGSSQVSFLPWGTIVSVSSWRKIPPPVLRGGSAGFPARGSCVLSGGV